MNCSKDMVISIVISGEAGQGIDTVSNILIKLLKIEGYNIFCCKEYMSRVRGGINSTQILVSSEKINAYSEKIDILLALDKEAFSHVSARISPDTAIICDRDNVDADFTKRCRTFELPIAALAQEAGSKLYLNTVSAGCILGLFQLDTALITEYIENIFESKSDDIRQKNINAALKGYNEGKKLVENADIKIKIDKDAGVKDKILLNGTESISLGCLSAGCNFISSYPMSPGTGVLTFMANASRTTDILVEQAEDEIAAINMAIGAWYSGARAMVTTSGGGFALMEEGVSLSGMLETPVVIHLAQRPGPATGLPTRTEQGDLELALYSGHGEFPRVIYVPGSLKQAYQLSQKAFNIADKYQIPVFILTDQYFLDSYSCIEPENVSEINIESYITETEPDYKRYKLTESGISPRGIPGFGNGLVNVDSDEHCEDGHITENLDLRVKMVDKRLKKLEALTLEALPPDLYGSENYENLIISWGSNLEIVNQALKSINRDDMAHLHFKQVYPLHPITLEFLANAKNTVIVENNATSQFGKLIKLSFGIDPKLKILKYNGLPFSIEELAEKFSNIRK